MTRICEKCLVEYEVESVTIGSGKNQDRIEHDPSLQYFDNCIFSLPTGYRMSHYCSLKCRYPKPGGNHANVSKNL